MSIGLAVLIAAACAGGGWLAGYLHNPTGPGRYHSPDLHRGRWGRPTVVGRHDQTRVVWELELGHPICVGSNHMAVKCTIGPGMAHLDECVCGATRSGVFGSWLSPRT